LIRHYYADALISPRHAGFHYAYADICHAIDDIIIDAAIAIFTPRHFSILLLFITAFASCHAIIFITPLLFHFLS